MAKLFRPELATLEPEGIKKAADALMRCHEQLDHDLAGREFLCGQFSRADFALTPHLASAAFMGFKIDRDRHPNLAAWSDRLRERPSIAQAMGEYGEGFRALQTARSTLFSIDRLHWRTDRIECALQCGLGAWLLGELKSDRAFLSPLV